MEATNCHFCQKEQFKYTCPKCNAVYCSVACYKSPIHLKCSEEFYKSCIQAELATTSKDPNDLHKMYDILKRMHEADAGFEPEYYDNLDSDDDLPEGAADDGIEDDDGDDGDDLATRLQNIDINDANEVWQHLTNDERQEFEKLVASGDIMKLIPNYTPWWTKQKQYAKIVEILPQNNTNGNKLNTNNQLQPEILQNITKFSEICQKTPSHCLHYNLWNILTAYSCVVKFFAGEHLKNPQEAAIHLVNLSTTLKYGTNFEDADDAIISVEMEALTTKNVTNSANFLFVENRKELQNDARQLMSKINNKLAALSDILKLLKLTKEIAKSMKKNQKEKDFQKLYALSVGSIELNKTKIQQLIKKIEFFLSYVNRDAIENII